MPAWTRNMNIYIDLVVDLVDASEWYYDVFGNVVEGYDED